MATNVISITKRTESLTLGGLGVVIASIVLSVASYDLLADTVRIRWTVGTHYHYGPEYAPTIAVLVVFPVLVAVLYAGARWLKSFLERTGEIDNFDEFSVIYDIAVVLVLGTIVAGQLVIIALNL